MKLTMVGKITLADLVRLTDDEKRDAAVREVLGIPVTQPIEIEIDEVLLRASGGSKPLGIYAGTPGTLYITTRPYKYGIYYALRVKVLNLCTGTCGTIQIKAVGKDALEKIRK